jgi:ubiquinone/menaquinone biosynthesis C-methylase UbiE
VLNAPERERRLPTARLVELLKLQSGETVVDYGAGTGRLALAIANALDDGGHIVAVDESPEMVERLAELLAGVDGARVPHVTANQVPLSDGAADRVLAVNQLHEVRGESALAELRPLLSPDGFALIVDRERGRKRDSGPPDHLPDTAADAEAELRAAGFTPERIDAGLPFHFVVRAHPVTNRTSRSPECCCDECTR